MNFLSSENYMQVDFPDKSYVGLRAFATRLHNDHEKYEMIRDEIDKSQFESLEEVKSCFDGLKVYYLLKGSILCNIPFVLLADRYKDQTIGVCFEPLLKNIG